jgi:hypothetical protein
VVTGSNVTGNLFHSDALSEYVKISLEVSSLMCKAFGIVLPSTFKLRLIQNKVSDVDVGKNAFHFDYSLFTCLMCPKHVNDSLGTTSSNLFVYSGAAALIEIQMKPSILYVQVGEAAEILTRGKSNLVARLHGVRDSIACDRLQCVVFTQPSWEYEFGSAFAATFDDDVGVYQKHVSDAFPHVPSLKGRLLEAMSVDPTVKFSTFQSVTTKNYYRKK